jgi:hypothetical protein
MSGGRRDSSLTRVQPTFVQLGRRQSSGVPWLAQLLRLGSRASVIRLPSDDEWTGVLTKPVEQCFEFSCSPPLDYLKALVREAPSRMPEGTQLHELEQRVSKDTADKRRQLKAQAPSAVDEALKHLAAGKTAPAWWVLEGTTMVDCALFARTVTIFIEGKRTEPHLTAAVSWDKRRHQVFRNLDGLEALPDRPEQYLMLLVVDEENGEVLHEAEVLDHQPNVAFASWPHRNPKEATALWAHYCGFTTWQRIASIFQLDLPPTRDEAIARGLTISPTHAPDGAEERR